MEFLKKELGLQDQVLDIKLINKALDKRECDLFELVLQHRFKLRVYTELKWEIGLEEYLQDVHVKRSPSTLFMKVSFGYHGFLRIG